MRNKRKRFAKIAKVKLRYITRTRILSRDFGLTNDAKFYASSSLTDKLNATYGITYGNRDWCRARYLFCEALRSTSVSPVCDWLGSEQICSSVGSRKHMNNCTHTKTRAKNLPFFILSEQWNSSTSMNCSPYARVPVQISIARDVGSRATEAGFGQVGMDQQFSARAFWSMRPRFEGDVSIVNSIFELKDFKDVLNLSKQLRNFTRAAKLLTEFSTYAITAKNKALKASTSAPETLSVLARDLTGTAANAQLTYSLAIMPTIKDYLAITAQLLTDVQEKQKTFRDFGEIGSASHYSEGSNTLQTTSAPYNGYAMGSGYTLSVLRTATARFEYSYIMRDRNEALRKFWGLTGTAEQLWNMLPMSFVIDYFLGVGKALSYMNWDENVTDLKTEYCESVRAVAASGHHILLSPRTPCVILDGKFVKIPKSGLRSLLVSGFEGTFYERKVMEPYKGPALPKLKVPSITQQANLLALARVFIS